MKKLAIIGAGISGLTLAELLKDKFDITIFEKSRGVGGRMSNRRANDFAFDFGAPFFTAKTDEFKKFLKPFEEKEIIQKWNPNFARIIDYKIDEIYKWGDKPIHYIASPYMTSFAKSLATNLKLKLSTQITKIEYYNSQINIFSNSQNLGVFDYIVTSIPPQQAYDILPDSLNYKTQLNEIEMLPCFSLMLGFSEPLDLTFDAAIIKQTDISFVSRIDSKPKRSKNHAISILSTNQWAKNNFSLDRIEIINHMKSEFEKILNYKMKNIIHEDLHRWKYANIHKQKGPEFYFDKELKIGSVGDWCIEGKVEGAFLSAFALYQKISKLNI